MSKFVKVQQGILGLGPGEYQRLCADYIKKKKGYENMIDFGSKEGTNKTTKGIPDSYSIDRDGLYSFIMYGTVEKKSITKLEKDIRDAGSTNKTGIPADKIKEIICFHTNTNIKPGEYDRLKNLHKDIKVELIDIDSMAHDICENYQSLANDYLQIPIDTNQISDITDFIKRYDKYSVNSPLSVEYIERKEKNEIINTIKDTDTILLISGKPGVGKTKISIEICKDLEKKENLKCLCIRPNGNDIYEDIKNILESNKKYLIFIDDINDLHQMQSFIDCIVTNENKNIKIIATVRDYLLTEILDKLNNYGIKSNIYTINPMKDADIIKILENSFKIENSNWQKQILKISNGNPRIAIMASNLILSGKVENFNSVLDVFKNYYDKIIEENKFTDIQIKILFYISILSPFSIENKDIKNTLETMQIYDIEEYKRLRDLELIEFYHDEAVKISDQNFANYIVYKYLIELKKIKISELLMKLYPRFIRKFINAINMLNKLFYNEKESEYIANEINYLWEKDEYKNEELFFKSFYNTNIPKALSIIYNKINNEKLTDIPKELNYKENVYTNDEILEILADIKNSNYSKMAFRLLMLYLDRRPDLYNEICENIEEYWLMQGINENFELEINIISSLFEKYNEKNEYFNILKLILIKSLKCCLKTEKHICEQGENSITVDVATITFQPSEELFEFRRFLFEIVIKVYEDDNSYANLLMDFDIWPNEEIQLSILKNDIRILEQKLFCKWNTPNIFQCKVLNYIEKMCEKRKVIIPESLQSYKKNKDYNILKVFEEYDKKSIELNKLMNKSSKEDYKTYFEILKNVENNKVKVNYGRISESISLLFKYIINNNINIFKAVFSYYLDCGCPFLKFPYYLCLINNKDDIINFLYEKQNNFKYFFLSILLDSCEDEKYLQYIKNFLKEQKNDKNKYTLKLSTIIYYSKFDAKIIEDYTTELLKNDKDNLLIDYLGDAFNNVEKAPKIYNAFNNKAILEQLYLKSLDKSMDVDGYMGFLLVKNNYKFFRKLIEKNNNEIYKIIKNIWLDNNSNELITEIYSEILTFNVRYLNLLFYYCNEKMKKIQNEWLKNYIKSNNTDKYKIKNVFYTICARDEKSRKDLIMFLLDNNNDIEIFKVIRIFSNYESWHNSRIPLMENKIKFLKNLKKEILNKGDIKYIFHINYLESIINNYKKDIERQRIEEYLDDFYN